MFSDVGKYVRRLIEEGASMAMPNHPDHAALDTRISETHGANVHADCIVSVLENGGSEYKQRRISGLALRYALLHGGCPLSSIKVFCGYGAARDTIEGPDGFLSLVDIMHMAPLQIATRQRAPAAIIRILLEYGADASLISTEAERRSSWVLAGKSKKKYTTQRQNH